MKIKNKGMMAGFIILLLSLGVVYANGGSVSDQNQVTIPAACGLSLSALINYGSVTAGAQTTMDANYITVTNSGNTATNVQINGTAWVHNSNTFLVSYTHYYNTTGQAYASKTALSATATNDKFGLAGGANYSSYLDVQAGATSAQAADTYYQNVTYTSSC